MTNKKNTVKEKFTSGKKVQYKITDAQQTELFNELIDNGFNISKACATLGIARNSYYYCIANDAAFKEKMDFSKSTLGSIMLTGSLEGLASNDLNVRLKYLELFAKSGSFTKLLGVESQDSKVNVVFNKDSIVLK